MDSEDTLSVFSDWVNCRQKEGETVESYCDRYLLMVGRLSTDVNKPPNWEKQQRKQFVEGLLRKYYFYVDGKATTKTLQGAMHAAVKAEGILTVDVGVCPPVRTPRSPRVAATGASTPAAKTPRIPKK